MNFHEGSRSEYLAQYVFTSFGTAFPVPHQEDSGLDLYCTLLEPQGKRAWPRAYYSVQVKSGMDPWVFGSPESVRWIIEHPLPIFLCVVQKKEATILVYQTAPRFAVWTLPEYPKRLELIPGTETKANAVNWTSGAGDTFNLEAPILSFTIEQLLDQECRDRVSKVLKLWIDCDMENLLRIRSGIQSFRVPSPYETNSTEIKGWGTQTTQFPREQPLSIIRERLNELLGLMSTYSYRQKDLVSAAIYAMALRQLSPSYTTRNAHDYHLQTELNRLLGMKPNYMFEACDSLLKIVKDELARHGVPSPGTTPLPQG